MGLTLLRHPRVDAPGICYGQSDVPLANGAEDAIAKTVLQVPQAQRLVSSPSPRCLALAEALSRATALPLTLDPRLLELDFGTWEGRAWSQIPRAESDAWAEDPVTRAPPGGESFGQLQTRVAAALTGLVRTLVVTHAGPIRAAQILTGRADFTAAFARAVPFATPIHLPALPGSI